MKPTALFAAALCATGLASRAAPPIGLSPVPATASAVNLPPHWRHGVFMEVFVRGCEDSDGDGIGDIKGLISRLDYLQDLGIEGLWLMLIQANADGGRQTRRTCASAPSARTCPTSTCATRRSSSTP